MIARFKRPILALTLAAMGILASPLSADQILMSNGDVISGKISKIEDKKVFIEPAYADEFSVDLSEVITIGTEQDFDIELRDGSKFSGQFAPGVDGEQKLIVDSLPRPLVLADLAEATEPEDWYDRTSHVDLNMTWNEGNTNSRNNLLYADTRLKLGEHRHVAELTIRRDETDGDRTKEQDLLRYSYNWLFNEPWYLGGTGSFERDPIKDLDHRYTLGLIFGRDFLDDSRRFLTASIGTGYSEEQIAGIAESGATGLWNLVYEHEFREGDLTFFHNQNLNYQFYGDHNAIFKTNTGFRFDIVSDVYASFSLRWDYESEPSADAKNSDTTLAVGVGAEF